MPNFLANVGSDCEVARFHVGMLRQLRSLNPATNMDAILRPLLSSGFHSAYWPASLDFPAWYWGGNQERKIVYLDGISSLRHAVGVVDGYGASAEFLAFRGLNPWLAAWVDQVLGLLTQGHWIDPEYMDFVGYSAGGAAATVAMHRFVAAQSPIKRKLITFGSPRAVTGQAVTALSRTPVTRWMNDNDPVPLVPPRLTDAPALVAVLNPLTAVRWSSFQHTGGGISLDVGGTPSAAVIPPSSSVNVIGSLASWFFSEEDSQSNPHSLAAYASRLDLALQSRITPTQRQADEGPVEAAADANRREVNREQDRVRAQIAEAGRAQNAIAVEMPDAAMFAAIKQDRIWCVYFADKLICQAPLEKRARAIARAGNAFLRALPKQALVDPIAILTQMETFLLLASTPETGFVPTIRTNLN